MSKLKLKKIKCCIIFFNMIFHSCIVLNEKHLIYTCPNAFVTLKRLSGKTLYFIYIYIFVHDRLSVSFLKLCVCIEVQHRTETSKLILPQDSRAAESSYFGFEYEHVNKYSNTIHLSVTFECKSIEYTIEYVVLGQDIALCHRTGILPCCTQ